MKFLNDYKGLEDKYKPNHLQNIRKHPLFGYIILSLGLIAMQLLFIFGDGIVSLTVSRAIAVTMIYAVAAMGLSILVGMAGLVSLGTSAFIGLGAYLAGNLLRNFVLPFSLILAIVILVAIVIGIVIGIISLRVRGIHLLIITLAFGTILIDLFRTPNQFTGGPSGLTNVPHPELAMFIQTSRDTVFFLILAVMFLLVLITLNIIRSPTGRAMLAMNNSEALAQAMGVRLLKYKVLAFVLATVYAMIAGVLFISSVTAATPASWTIPLSLNMLVAVVLGGGLKPAGVFLGTFIIFGIDMAILSRIPFFLNFPAASSIFSGILIIVIVFKYPGGLMKLLNDIKFFLFSLIKRWRVYKYGPEV